MSENKPVNAPVVSPQFGAPNEEGYYRVPLMNLNYTDGSGNVYAEKVLRTALDDFKNRRTTIVLGEIFPPQRGLVKNSVVADGMVSHKVLADTIEIDDNGNVTALAKSAGPFKPMFDNYLSDGCLKLGMRAEIFLDEEVTDSKLVVKLVIIAFDMLGVGINGAPYNPLKENDEEDLLRYAYLDRGAIKYYAVKFRGSVSELPYFFLSHLKKFYPFHVEVDGVLTLEPGMNCSAGDYLIVYENKAHCTTAVNFHASFIPTTQL